MVFIVIPVHNRVASTLRCLASILEQSYKSVSIIVVDDGSSDFTAAKIMALYPEAVVLNGTGNLFWTGAVHLGISYSLKHASPGDWLLLMNNDVVLGHNTLEDIVSAGDNSNRLALVSALTLDIVDRDTVVTTGTTVLSWVFNRTKHVYARASHSAISAFQPISVDFLTARCLLHPIEVFNVVGQYDSCRFPHYAGDDEFTYRAKRCGYDLLIFPNITVFLDATRQIDRLRFRSYYEYLKFRLFDVRSSINIKDKFRFSLHVAPWYAMPTYFAIGAIKSLYCALFR